MRLDKEAIVRMLRDEPKFASSVTRKPSSAGEDSPTFNCPASLPGTGSAPARRPQRARRNRGPCGVVVGGRAALDRSPRPPRRAGGPARGQPTFARRVSRRELSSAADSSLIHPPETGKFAGYPDAPATSPPWWGHRWTGILSRGRRFKSANAEHLARVRRYQAPEGHPHPPIRRPRATRLIEPWALAPFHPDWPLLNFEAAPFDVGCRPKFCNMANEL
jgi:hypothetical protein